MSQIPEPTTPKKSKKKLIIIVSIVLALAIAGAAAYFLLLSKGSASHKEAKTEIVEEKTKEGEEELPIFVALETFTVNLQPYTSEKFLQVSMTLQVRNQKEAEAIKNYMPLIRDRINILLSSQNADEITLAEGKNMLAKKIIEQVTAPISGKSAIKNVSHVMFTSFIIQ